MVARWTTLGEAEAALTALDAADIVAWLDDEHIVGISWLNSNAVGGVKVAVRPEDEDEAREVLTTPAVEIVGPDAPEEHFIEVLICPQCESEEVVRIRKGPAFAVIAVVVFAASIALRQPTGGLFAVFVLALVFLFTPTHRCGACGARWSTDDVLPPPPLPTAADLEATRCPRCGADALYRIPHRRLIAASMFFGILPVVGAVLWLLLPKRRCENCGSERWW